MLGGAQVLGGQWKDQGSPGRAAGGGVLGKGVRTGSQVHPTARHAAQSGDSSGVLLMNSEQQRVFKQYLHVTFVLF